MNVGNVAHSMNPYLGTYKSASKTQAGNFQNTMSAVGTPSKPLQLHGMYGSTAEDGSQVVGAWADAVAGTSATVYKPADFNPEEPVYTMKIWDSDNNLLEERTVNLNDVDVNHCDNFDMYAYSCYLSKSGKYPDAMNKFLMMPAQEKGYDTDYDLSSMFEKKNWVSILKDLMDMQYKLGNHHGYMEYKKFHDFLVGQNN